MTSLSITAALAPVAIGAEAGSELLRSTAVVLIGGLTTSTLLTLVVVPAMYTIFDDIQQVFLRLAHRVAAPRPLEPEELAILHPDLARTVDGVVRAGQELDGKVAGVTSEALA